MAVEVENVSWLGLVASSAVVSALVNVGWNAWTKHQDRKREDAQEAKKIGHIYLDIALQLEAFGKRCGARLYDIDRGLSARAAEHDETYLNQLKPLAFSFDPEPNWNELPIEFVAKMKMLPNQYASTKEWISAQWDYWADLEDLYGLEKQCIAYYGLKVFQIAAEIRLSIGAGSESDRTLFEHFLTEIDERRKAFRKYHNDVTLIPELEAMFGSEHLRALA